MIHRCCESCVFYRRENMQRSAHCARVQRPCVIAVCYDDECSKSLRYWEPRLPEVPQLRRPMWKRILFLK